MAEPRRSHVPTYSAPGARFLIVEARYYDGIGEMLLAGAVRALEAAGAGHELISVPGALEIPAAIKLGLKAGSYAGAIALGCVIRGETSHYDIVAGDSARALMDFSVAHRFPIGNGILTVDTDAQAQCRADTSKDDKGGGAARAVLSLIALKRQFERKKR